MEIVSLNARSSEEYFGGSGKVNRQGLFSIGDLNLIVAVSDFTCAVLSSLIAEAEHFLLCWPGAGQSLCKARDPQTGGGGTVGDRLNDLRGKKRERHEAADMTLGETFGRNDLVGRCSLASEERIHPAVRARNRL